MEFVIVARGETDFGGLVNERFLVVRHMIPISPYLSDDIFVRNPPEQTLKAWAPFWDCVNILFEFQNSDVDEERTEWKLFWIAGVALLRAIGHVLAKSDAAVSPKHKVEIDKLWAEWKLARDENDIFWNFIEEERNNILKTYEFGARLVQDEQGYYVSYKNRNDAFKVFGEATYWWRYQLERLEARIIITSNES